MTIPSQPALLTLGTKLYSSTIGGTPAEGSVVIPPPGSEKQLCCAGKKRKKKEKIEKTKEKAT